MKPLTNPDDITNHNNEVASMFDDMEPFTITINNGHDAAWFSSAMFSYLTGGDDKLSERGFILLIRAAKEHGVEHGVNMFFDSAFEEEHRFPAFMRPVFKHMLTHALKKYSLRAKE